MDTSLEFKLSVLVFIKNAQDEFLLIKRNKSPNKGCWSPIGGKIETHLGESPFECAVREAKEEVNLDISTDDLHLFSMITEKAYEGKNHWLLFLFNCKKPMDILPEPIDEGHFGFFGRNSINSLNIPLSDEKLLWETYDQNSAGFKAIKANFLNHNELKIQTEQVI